MKQVNLFPDYVDVAAQREVAENRYRFILDAMCASEGEIDIEHIDSEICKILGKHQFINVSSFPEIPDDKIEQVNRMLGAAVSYINNNPGEDLDYYMEYDEEAGEFKPEEGLW